MNLFNLAKLAFGLVLVFPTLASAAKIRMLCITEFPTTSYQITEEAEEFVLLTYHHNGTKYLPLYSGTITPNDLPMLAQRAEQLQKMGSVSYISFKKSECSNKGIYWKCSRKSPVKVGQLDVERVFFMMGKMEKKYEDYEWETVETYLSLKVDGKDLPINYSFMRADCSGN